MPLVTPCAHLLCVDCAAPHRHALSLLLQTFVEDDFAAGTSCWLGGHWDDLWLLQAGRSARCARSRTGCRVWRTQSGAKQTQIPSGKCPSTSSSGSPATLSRCVQPASLGVKYAMLTRLTHFFPRSKSLTRLGPPQRWSFGVQGALGISGGDWSLTWQNTNSSKCMHLLQRLVSIGAAPQSGPSNSSKVGNESVSIPRPCVESISVHT